jgi:hypothetical protein
MKVSLNLKPCAVPEDLATLHDVIVFVEKERVPQGQGLIRIVLDGEILEDEDERERAGEPVSGIEVLEFYSARPIDLIAEGLGFATELLPSLAEDLGQSTKDLRSGNIQDGLSGFAEALSYVGWYIRIVESAYEILVELDPSLSGQVASIQSAEGDSPEEELSRVTSIDGPELRTFASLENLRQKLNDIMAAQQNQDTVLLADMIEYEMLPIIKLWIEEVPTILKMVERETGTA